jgi:hypothetical protein
MPLLKSWAEQGIAHGGVVFVDDRTIAQNDLGGLLRSLGALWSEKENSAWRNAVSFLVRWSAVGIDLQKAPGRAYSCIAFSHRLRRFAL